MHVSLGFCRQPWFWALRTSGWDYFQFPPRVWSKTWRGERKWEISDTPGLVLCPPLVFVLFTIGVRCCEISAVTGLLPPVSRYVGFWFVFFSLTCTSPWYENIVEKESGWEGQERCSLYRIIRENFWDRSISPGLRSITQNSLIFFKISCVGSLVAAHGIFIAQAGSFLVLHELCSCDVDSVVAVWGLSSSRHVGS